MLIVSWMAGTGMLTLAQGMPALYALNVEIDIKTMCIEAGITQVQLANMLGITPAYVNRIIRQKETVVAIARSGATDERGGRRRMLLNTVKGE